MRKKRRVEGRMNGWKEGREVPEGGLKGQKPGMMEVRNQAGRKDGRQASREEDWKERIKTGRQDERLSDRLEE